MDLLRQEAARTRRTFRDVLNERLRLGYSSTTARKEHTKFTVVPLTSEGFAPGVDERKLNQLLDELETAEFKS